MNIKIKNGSVTIKSFRSVTIFGKNYTKIIYRHSQNDFSIEKVGDDIDLDENVQVISGPRSEEIVAEIIKNENIKGSTFVWNGARYLSEGDIIPDMVESEEIRRDRRKHHNEQ